MLFPSNIEGFFGSTQMTYLRFVETGESTSMTDFPSSNAIADREGAGTAKSIIRGQGPQGRDR